MKAIYFFTILSLFLIGSSHLTSAKDASPSYDYTIGFLIDTWYNSTSNLYIPIRNFPDVSVENFVEVACSNFNKPNVDMIVFISDYQCPEINETELCTGANFDLYPEFLTSADTTLYGVEAITTTPLNYGYSILEYSQENCSGFNECGKLICKMICSLKMADGIGIVPSIKVNNNCI